MKQSEIKNKCEQAYQNIRLQQDEINQLRSICKHINTHNVAYVNPEVTSFRIRSNIPAIICSDCGEVVSTDWQKLGEIKREEI